MDQLSPTEALHFPKMLALTFSGQDKDPQASLVEELPLMPKSRGNIQRKQLHLCWKKKINWVC